MRIKIDYKIDVKDETPLKKFVYKNQNKIIMKTLTERLLEITVANTVKKSVKTSINDLILKVLTEKNEKLSRPEIVSRIAKLRYEDEFKKELKDSDLDNPEVLEDLLKIIKTVKNGVDTSISKSNNNSSFHYNENFSKYELLEINNKYFIEKRELKK